ncbi:ATP-binding cassette domain-containing protein [Gordonia amarae]|uniref:ATP-binding cassette domain-containing protein n=1 Tax=Gordonia amarae TaxID=36821 RepID=A0A857LQY3_9ACTN|nr:ABC transporter ATP-binding protein [Gordonia amarae]MCS3880241.1 ATP-binding cassette subfamily B protein [Gordonia amarae]QHN18598.1 ATP-binding cassette domain-containing protein [Gordonia amarae]QHN23073.1 ATP-binding cassette domain-containing protein [Gordonia amarae]QHN31974.1 ATP-binding cassette domain-containing protein [Gordonia amarae]QHN40721.1 ATP-binding cassette domain-containing protein [Gordonia amarae]
MTPTGSTTPHTPSGTTDAAPRRPLTVLFTEALAPRRRLVALFALCQLAATFTALAQPALNARIIDDGIMAGDTGTIYRVGGYMLIVAVVNLAVSLAATYLSAHIASEMARDLRISVRDRVALLSDAQASRFGVPSLLTRATGDVSNVQVLLFATLAIAITAPFMLVGAAILSLIQGWRLAPVIVVAGIILSVGMGLFVRQLIPAATLMQKRIDTLNRVIREQLSGQRVIRAFSRERTELRRYDDANTDLFTVALWMGRWQTALLPTVTVVAGLASVAVSGFGAVFIDHGWMKIGQLTATSGYLMQILVAVSMLSVVAGVASRASASAARIIEVRDTEASIDGATSRRDDGSLAALGVTDRAPLVELDGVSFRYAGAESPALDSVSLAFRPQSTTGIIGGTASGKSTLLALVPRLIDPTSGAVRWNGADTADFAPAAVRSRISYISAGTSLITGTIATNLRIGKADADDDELWQALDLAAANFVRERDGGLDAEVTQGGRNFSGGQRQRLALARALLRRPDIFVLDEPFSALDTDTEQAVVSAIRAACPTSSIVIGTQRVSSIRRADQIAVIDAGRIVAVGTHQSLLAGSTVYRELADAQAVAGV